MQTPTDVRTTINLTLLAAVLSGLALLLSVVTAVQVFVEDDMDKVESRLACLELPGPNDCGLDGR